MKQDYLVFLVLGLMATSCQTLRDTPKYEFSSGVYWHKSANQSLERVYVMVEDQQLSFFLIDKKSSEIDSASAHRLDFTKESRVYNPKSVFSRRSFDVDVLTIPFKFRPGLGDVPNQLTTNFNGAVYVGFRSDSYHLSYQQTQLSNYRRHFSHFGYSLGLFTGIGSTYIQPLVMNNKLNIDYEGVVWSKGVAGIVAVGNLTFGLGLGFDHLLDQNAKLWVYQGKPWLGLTLGLNLN